MSRAAAFALAAVVLCGRPAFAQSGGFAPAAPTPAQVGDVVTTIAADGVRFRFISEKGSEAFRAPSDWPVIAVQSSPPVAVAAFQVPDDLTGDGSAGVVFSVFSLDADQGRAAAAGVGKAFGDKPTSVERYGRWVIHRQVAPQGPTLFTVLDGLEQAPDLGVAIAVRMAWPHLDGAPPGRDADMARLYRQLLDSVSARPGAYVPGPEETVRRPTAAP